MSGKGATPAGGWGMRTSVWVHMVRRLLTMWHRALESAGDRPGPNGPRGPLPASVRAGAADRSSVFAQEDPGHGLESVRPADEGLVDGGHPPARAAGAPRRRRPRRPCWAAAPPRRPRGAPARARTAPPSAPSQRAPAAGPGSRSASSSARPAADRRTSSSTAPRTRPSARARPARRPSSAPAAARGRAADRRLPPCRGRPGAADPSRPPGACGCTPPVPCTPGHAAPYPLVFATQTRPSVLKKGVGSRGFAAGPPAG
jgi:hypothetical protein